MIESAILCLAMNVYHEARGEPITGQMAVAMVTLNRAKWKKERVCPEVFRYAQFSWTLKGRPPITEKKAWEQSLKIAKTAWISRDPTGGATHFHAAHITPYWAASLTYVGQWGNHVFYKQN